MVNDIDVLLELLIKEFKDSNYTWKQIYYGDEETYTTLLSFYEDAEFQVTLAFDPSSGTIALYIDNILITTDYNNGKYQKYLDILLDIANTAFMQNKMVEKTIDKELLADLVNVVTIWLKGRNNV